MFRKVQIIDDAFKIILLIDQVSALGGFGLLLYDVSLKMFIVVLSI